jgi:agmatine deiminase
VHLNRTAIRTWTQALREYLESTSPRRDSDWIASGIEGDDTDGHIDDFARFSSPSSVLCAFSEKGENAPVLERNWSLLERAKDRFGLELQRLPMPEPLYLKEEDRNLPASYANFYIGNKVVLLPVFEDPMDRTAIDIISTHFPGREIVPIVARELVYGYGGIHCVTQQEPAERG